MPAVRRVVCALLGALCLCPMAWADNHALIMWIGQYANAGVRIGGLERDAAMAREMARTLGVPASNILERSNAQLTYAGLRDALAGLRARVHQGDNVMVYFSGHGRQLQRLNGKPGCSEGLATYEGAIYFDVLLRDELDALAATADRVLMFNDSCFSGGTATKALTLSPDDGVAKSYPAWATNTTATSKSADVAEASQVCGAPTNPVSKAFGAAAQRRSGLVYLAASAADQAAYSGPQGSFATRAWAACLGGAASAAALQQCAQQWLQRNSQYTQTITLVGEGRSSVKWASASAP